MKTTHGNGSWRGPLRAMAPGISSLATPQRGQWAALLAAACVATAPHAAEAAQAPANPPNASAIRAAGLKVIWPLDHATTTVEVGDRLVVRVSPVGRRRARRPAARIALDHVDQNGGMIRNVIRRSVRVGAVAVRIPNRPGARYALRLRVAKQRYWSWITAKQAMTGVASPSAPTCTLAGRSAGELSLDPAFGRSGDQFAVHLRNTGTSCLSGGWDYGWQQQLPDGTWQPVASRGFPVPAIAVITPPGSISSHSAVVWPELAPGAYRLIKFVNGPYGTLTLAATFDIQA